MTSLQLHFGLIFCAAIAVAQPAGAQVLSGWGLDTGLAAATLTEGAPGSFSTTVPTGNAGPRALLPTPISLANIGESALLSGTVSFSGNPTNQQFRFGLFNSNGASTGTLASALWSGATTTGWLGYMTQMGGAGGTDSVKGRSGTGTGVWLSNTNAYVVGDGPGGQSNLSGGTPYNFSFKLTRTAAASIKADYTFAGGAVNRSGTYTDVGGASADLTSFNAVGFLLNGSTGSGTFSNLRVEIPQELKLRVNTTSGAIAIFNGSGTPLDLKYYEVRSAAGALNPVAWNSLDFQEGGDPVGTGWDSAGGSSANILAEVNLSGATTLTPTNSIVLGTAFLVGAAQDLTFSYSLDGQTTMLPAAVEYFAGPAGVLGDYNNNGAVDAADYTRWRDGGPLLNESATPGLLNAADYSYWQSRFGETSAVASTATVPEPQAWLLAIVGVAFATRASLARRG